MKRVFISKSQDDNVADIISRLRDRQYTIETASALPIGSALTSSLKRAIASADIFIAVLSDTKKDSNVYFEAGMAAASGKPIVFVFSEPYPNLPLDFDGYVRVPRSDYQAFSSFIDHMTVPNKKASLKNFPERRSQITLSPNANEIHIVEALERSFRDAGFEVERGRGNDGADLILWSDAFASNIGNPIAVEVKRHISSRGQLQTVIQGAETILQTVRLTSAYLLVYFDSYADITDEPFPDRFRAISVDALVKQLNVKGPHKALRAIFSRRSKSVTDG